MKYEGAFYSMHPGQHFAEACIEACALAHERMVPIHFEYLGTILAAHPGSKPEEVMAAWVRQRRARWPEIS